MTTKMRRVLIIAIAVASLVLAVTEASAQFSPSFPAFIQQGTGAVARAWINKAQDVFDGRDYGVKCDNSTDDGPAIQLGINAIATLAPVRGGILDLPTGQCKIATQVAITTNNITLRGRGMYATALVVSSTVLQPIVATTVTGLHFVDFGITGPGATSTTVGIQLNNVWESRMTRVDLEKFNVGLRLSPGANSSYSFSIYDSIIVKNNTTNIDAQAGSNNLAIYHASFGGTPAQRGVKVVDSTDFKVYGGDCEGVSVACIDLDATADNANYSGHLITGIHFEANTSSVADIVLGTTNPIYSAQISGNFFSAGAADQYPIKLVKAQNVIISGNVVASGYAAGSYPFLGTTVNVTSLANRWPLPNFAAVSGADVILGATDLTTAPSSNLEVQGTTGITVSRNVNTTGSGMQYKFRQKDAGNTWVDYGYFKGSLIAAGAGAVSAEMRLNMKDGGTDTDLMIWDIYGYTPRTRTAATLGTGTPPNGRILYCTDCTIANPCAGGGTGAIAKRLNGVWVCN